MLSIQYESAVLPLLLTKTVVLGLTSSLDFINKSASAANLPNTLAASSLAP
jgi:hypothetical protein